MCEHISSISNINYILLVKSSKQFDDEWKQMKKDKTSDYMFCKCDICGESDEQLSYHSYYLKCPICKKIICNKCQNIVSYCDISELNKFLEISNLDMDCVKRCNECCKYNSILSTYKCDRCKKTYNGCDNCKEELFEIYEDNPEYVCHKCLTCISKN
jgi:hypothetical protein